MTALSSFASANTAHLTALRVLQTGLCWSCLALGCFSCNSEESRPPDASASKPWRALPAQAKPAPAGEYVERYAALSSAFKGVMSRKVAATSPAQWIRERALLDSLRQAPLTPTGEELHARILGFASAAEQSRLHRAVIDAEQAARRHNPAFFAQSPQSYKQWWLEYSRTHRPALAENRRPSAE
jgi:hypothetical protein